MEHTLLAVLSKFTYLALVAILAVAGLGVPVSEDLTLMIAGLLAARGVTSFVPTLIVGYLGVLFGDALIHQWGRRLGPRATAQPWVRRAITPAREEQLRVHFQKHGALTVIVGRHLPVARAPIFFLAGANGVPLWKFVLADAVTAAVTVPLVTWLGFKFGEHLDELRARIHHAEWVIAAVVVVVALALWLWRRRRDPPLKREGGVL